MHSGIEISNACRLNTTTIFVARIQASLSDKAIRVEADVIDLLEIVGSVPSDILPTTVYHGVRIVH